MFLERVEILDLVQRAEQLAESLAREPFIEDADHAPHWEQPEAFNALLAKFVTDVRNRNST